MNGIIGILRSCKSERQITTKLFKQYITPAIVNSKQLLMQINDILDLAQLNANKLKIRLSRFNLRDKLDDIVSIIRPQAEIKQLKLRLLYDTTVPEWIESDPKRLGQILINLLGNALKFTLQGLI